MNSHDDLEAYVLGALEAGEATAFEAHVATCSDCRNGAASYGGVLRALRALPVAAPPASPRPQVALRAPIGWIAAVAAAAIVGIAVGQHTPMAPDRDGPIPVRSDGDVAMIAEMIAMHAREVALAGTTARGAAIVGTRGDRTAFLVSGLPAPPAGRGYQVWVRGAKVRSPGMLHRTAGGLEVLVVPGDVLAGALRIGITIEPAGGSPARTGPAQATGKVS